MVHRARQGEEERERPGRRTMIVVQTRIHASQAEPKSARRDRSLAMKRSRPRLGGHSWSDSPCQNKESTAWTQNKENEEKAVAKSSLSLSVCSLVPAETAALVLPTPDGIWARRCPRSEKTTACAVCGLLARCQWLASWVCPRSWNEEEVLRGHGSASPAARPLRSCL
ncbi:hypothetical protein MRX96_028558 [Rhipicephalus microplus]